MAIDGDDLFPNGENDYPAMFQQYIVNQIENVLAEVSNIPQTIPSELRSSAWHILDYALKRPKFWVLARDLLLILTPKMEQEGFRDEWVSYLENGIQKSKTQSDVRAEAELALALGRIEQLQGRYDAAQEHLQQSVICFDTLRDKNNRAKALNRLAFVARQQADHQLAEQLSREALEILAHDDIERANCFYVQGAIAFDQGDWVAAEKFYRKSLIIWESSHDRRRIASGYRNLGNVLGCQKKYENAIVYYKDAINRRWSWIRPRGGGVEKKRERR